MQSILDTITYDNILHYNIYIYIDLYIALVYTYNTVWTLIFAVLNFRGLSIFAFSAFLFSRMRVPQYYIKYIDYMSVLICASHISHITKHVWAARRVGVAIAKQ